MAIPDYQSMRRPLLKLAGDDEEYSSREAIEMLADKFAPAGDVCRELLPSNCQPAFYHRVGRARSHMKRILAQESLCP